MGMRRQANRHETRAGFGFDEGMMQLRNDLTSHGEHNKLDSVRRRLCFHCFPLFCSLFFFFFPPLSFAVNLLEILWGSKPLSLSASPHPLLTNPPLPPSPAHTHLVSWLQQGLKRLQFISTRSGWRPHLVAAGNSISLPHADE